MSTSQVFKEVMREYEKDKNAAARLSEARLNELYRKLPRVGEIDRELANMGLSVTKLILMGEGDREAAVLALAERSETLAEEREALLYENGYDLSYFEDVYKCVICKDTGFVENKRCRCLQQRLIEKYYEMSSLSKALESENFDSFNINYYSDEVDPKTGISPRANISKVWTMSLKFVENFDTDFKNLLLYGETGLGKTFLCNCIAKDLLDKGKTVLYVTAAQLFKMIEEFRFNRKEDDEPDQYIDMILHSDLLIIDDLGTEFSTVITDSEFFNFINTRLLNQKSTIISTNISPSDFEAHYSDRITSRLFGNYTLLQFVGEDIRLMKKYRNI